MPNQMICEHCQKKCKGTTYFETGSKICYNEVGQKCEERILKYFCCMDCMMGHRAVVKRKNAIEKMDFIRVAQQRIILAKEELKTQTDQQTIDVLDITISFNLMLIEAVKRKISKEAFKKSSSMMMEFAHEFGDQFMCDTTTRTLYAIAMYDTD
jgi:hypothetical protein